ncbi:hypothetical protein V6N11_074407 [Hibiscus sabdariffa]|uniref:Uncharacterized protein n=1 Tax=Hibiscus sabdariffa TaxID=183260 RepID=A0ABR2R3G5_9ROSI
MLGGVDSPWKVVLVAVLLELDVFFCGKLARRCYPLAPADEGLVSNSQLVGVDLQDPTIVEDFIRGFNSLEESIIVNVMVDWLTRDGSRRNEVLKAWW